MGGPKKKQAGKAGAAKKAEPQIVPHRNLYVGNLAGMEMTQEKLSDLFKACGEVTKVQFVAEPLPPAKNPFGLVEFATVEDASSAIAKLNGESGMFVKYHNTLSDGTNAPKELPSTVSREAVVEEQEEAQEGQTEEASGDEKPEDVCTALVHADPVGAARRNYPNPVDNLQALVQNATMEGASTKDHIIYTVEEIEEDFGALVATIELRLPAGCHTSRGEPKDTKKEATKSAAQVALRNPEVHRLLPPLPPKVREVKASIAEHLEDEEENSQEEEEESELASTACTEKLSVKKQRQLQKEEVRAKRQAKRNAAKAIKAALAAGESDSDGDEEEDEESEDREDSTRGDSEDQEESEEEDSEESSDEDDDRCVNAAELAAKMKVIKERIGSTSKSRGRDGKSAGSAKEKGKSGTDKAARKIEKAAQKSQQQSDVKDIGIEVVFTSAWSATGAKTNYVKP